MQNQMIADQAMNEQVETAQKLRPVVITVIAAKLAVAALLMTTINLHVPVTSPIEVAAIR